MDSVTQHVIRTAAPRFTASLSPKQARYLFESGERIRGGGLISDGFGFDLFACGFRAVMLCATSVIENN